jgi:hypothetical protein
MAESELDIEDQQRRLLAFLLRLRLDRVREFLVRSGLPKSGTRDELRERLVDSLHTTAVTVDQLVEFLDEVEPWSKQHVYLFDGDDGIVNAWRDPARVHQRLARANLAELLNAHLPLILPVQLTLSSIRVEEERYVTISAVERREHNEHEEWRDYEQNLDDGDVVEWRAFVRRVTRGLVTFRWDLTANTATLHITQGESGYDYAGVKDRFGNLVATFLAFDRFHTTYLHGVIRRVHDMERYGNAEARSHRLSYRSPGGRSIDAASPSNKDSVTGEAAIDEPLTAIAGESTGQLGNFYWLAGITPTLGIPNPLAENLHVVVVPNDGRVNFMVPSSSEAVTYVLQRIRALT